MMAAVTGEIALRRLSKDLSEKSVLIGVMGWCRQAMEIMAFYTSCFLQSLVLVQKLCNCWLNIFVVKRFCGVQAKLWYLIRSLLRLHDILNGVFIYSNRSAIWQAPWEQCYQNPGTGWSGNPKRNTCDIETQHKIILTLKQFFWGIT